MFFFRVNGKINFNCTYVMCAHMSENGLLIRMRVGGVFFIRFSICWSFARAISERLIEQHTVNFVQSTTIPLLSIECQVYKPEHILHNSFNLQTNKRSLIGTPISRQHFLMQTFWHKHIKSHEKKQHTDEDTHPLTQRIAHEHILQTHESIR